MAQNVINFINMKTKIFLSLYLLAGLAIHYQASGQCEIKNRIYPDGSMMFYMEPVNFYWTEAKSLKGGIVTDKESFYLALRPIPFPDKPEGKKLKSDLVLSLSDGKEYQLQHFDTRYLEGDSIMEILFLIGEDALDKVRMFEVINAKIDMKGEEGIRTYVFKLHKSALREELECFSKKAEENKK
jgi:hypothetical protein